MRNYEIEYKTFDADDVHRMTITAKDKLDAYYKAMYEELEELPYSLWVSGYIKKDLEFVRFNTHEGKPV